MADSSELHGTGKRQVILNLDSYQIGLLLTYTGNAADNLHDQRQAGWECMTPDEDKLAEYGTTDYDEAQGKISDIVSQLEAYQSP